MVNFILTPVLALVAWTLLVWLWMYATRIPAMQRLKIEPQTGAHPGSLDVLPSSVRSVADNYNHLMEQPTLFYALLVYLHLTHQGDALNIGLAWAYVALRVVHSLVQNTSNVVLVRFLVFSVSTLALFAMTARAVVALL
jgi:hypothetical protein